MKYEDIKSALQNGNRASLSPDRKAAMREKLRAQMAVEQTRVMTPRKRRRRLSPYLYTAAGIIVAAGVAGKMITNPQLKNTAQSASGYGTSASSAAASSGTKSATKQGTSQASHTDAYSAQNSAATSADDASVKLTYITMDSTSSGWAVDSRGRLLHSVDNGHTWENVTPQGVQLSLDRSSGGTSVVADWQKSVAGFSPKDDSGTIYTTHNSGQTWTKGHVAVSTDSRVEQIQFVNTDTGFAVVQANLVASGQFELWRTDDGGSTWKRIFASDDGAHVQASVNIHRNDLVSFSSPTNGWRLAQGTKTQQLTVQRTIDGGRTWHVWRGTLPVPKQLQAGTAELDVLPIFWGPNGIWPVEYRMPGKSGSAYVEVYKTTDGGSSWQATTPLANPGGSDLYFATPSLGFLVEHTTNRMERTVDGGESWTTIPTAENLARLSTLTFTDANHGYAIVVPQPGNNGALLETHDGGRTWQNAQPWLQAPRNNQK
ncbi:WD40/YVTN/BNR-like repeat-containing protein [Alicyclobacillus dauci]|uniref:Photosynthesis system II assembly factor Ycf48/Hcf136-like domain-containing protein n=1 Tax=Alicyclobacillus dauci TaxID=1475485 RepID=A0ABY6Z1G8_9BACL|nr:hypothetical protein [Alicyclobacillus dauci]WAH36071.1 hypothetical protein NZD86_17710 [Alicyclobacillus dauci]